MRGVRRAGYARGPSGGNGGHALGDRGGRRGPVSYTHLIALLAGSAIGSAMSGFMGGLVGMLSLIHISLTEQAQDAAAYLNETPSDENVPSLLAQFAGTVRYTLIAADGRVLFDSASADASAAENHGSRPEVREALDDGHGSVVRYLSLIHIFRLPLGRVDLPRAGRRLLSRDLRVGSSCCLLYTSRCV